MLKPNCLYSLILIPITIAFTSCDYQGYETMKINNKSDSTITLKFNSITDGPDTNTIGFKIVELKPKERGTLFISYRGINERASDKYSDTMEMFQFIDVMTINGNDTNKSNKNYRDRINWEYKATDEWSTQYRIDINNDEFN